METEQRWCMFQAAAQRLDAGSLLALLWWVNWRLMREEMNGIKWN